MVVVCLKLLPHNLSTKREENCEKHISIVGTGQKFGHIDSRKWSRNYNHATSMFRLMVNEKRDLEGGQNEKRRWWVPWNSNRKRRREKKCWVIKLWVFRRAEYIAHKGEARRRQRRVLKWISGKQLLDSSVIHFFINYLFICDLFKDFFDIILNKTSNSMSNKSYRKKQLWHV